MVRLGDFLVMLHLRGEGVSGINVGEGMLLIVLGDVFLSHL